MCYGITFTLSNRNHLIDKGVWAVIRNHIYRECGQ